MPLLLLAVVSVAVGAVVYLGTVQGAADGHASSGFGDDEVEPVTALDPADPWPPPPGYAYLRVSTQGPSLRERLVGFIGVLLLIAASAAILAFALYQVGHLINGTIEAFLEQ